MEEEIYCVLKNVLLGIETLKLERYNNAIHIIPSWISSEFVKCKKTEEGIWKFQTNTIASLQLDSNNFPSANSIFYFMRFTRKF